MKTFPIRQIQQQKKDFTAEKLPTVEVVCAGHFFHCFVLPRSMADLRYFAFRMTPKTSLIKRSKKPDSITLFGVSEEVPKEFREMWLYHEVYEFCVQGIESESRCAHAMEEELSYAAAAMQAPKTERGRRKMRAYCKLRLDFFRRLIDFGIRNRFDYADLEQIVESKNLIEVKMRIF